MVFLSALTGEAGMGRDSDKEKAACQSFIFAKGRQNVKGKRAGLMAP